MKMLQYIMCGMLASSLLMAGGAPESKKKKTGFSLSKLQATYKGTKSMDTDFVQEVYQASLARTKTSKGNLKLAKPNLVRWEIYEPEASIMVSNGRKVSYFTPDARGKGKGQVIERKSAELERQPLFQILTGAVSLEKEFTVKKREKKGELTELTLAPKAQIADLAQVVLKVNAKYLIEDMIFETQSGNTTKFTLQNQSLGARFPAQIFDFKAPAGTEIVNN